jgi:hypothetical protein
MCAKVLALLRILGADGTSFFGFLATNQPARMKYYKK